MSRRTEKRVYTHNGSAWAATPSEHKRFVWSGWLMLLELDETAGTPPTIAVRRKQTWGLDLAGQHGGGNSLESAGGIGGLLSIYDTVGTGSTSDDRSFALLYDANGNVGQLLELTAGTNYGAVAVKYEYDAYGNRINTPASGEYEQPWQFSTKWYDAETGLSYYGYRYYAGRMGRWVSRDPLGERGGIHLMQYVANQPTNVIDPVGLCPTVQWRNSIEFDRTTPTHQAITGAVNTDLSVRVIDDDSCCYCNDIRWVQIVQERYVRWDAWGVGVFPVTGNSDWRIDNGASWVNIVGFGVDSLFYPRDPEGEFSYFSTGMSHGKCTSRATLSDKPGAPAPGWTSWLYYHEMIEQDFETCAVCFRGGACNDNGAGMCILGCVTWGHSFSFFNGQLARSKYMTQPSRPSSDMLRLIASTGRSVGTMCVCDGKAIGIE